MQENQIARLFLDNSIMQEIYRTEKGLVIIGAWGKDVGTMKRRLKLVFVYPNGAISPIQEYPQGKLTDAKALKDLADLDGVRPDMLKSIYTAIMESMDKLPVQEDSDGTCSIYEAYRMLSASKAAKQIGVSRSTWYRKVKEYEEDNQYIDL